MGIDVRILPRRGVVVVRYSGTIMVAETMEAFGAYMSHPDYAPGQKQLIDLSGVVGYETDYVKIMKLQAKKADAFIRGGALVLMVYYAPNKTTLGLAHLIARSWEGIDGLTALVQQDETRALALLGIDAPSIDALMAETG